MLLTTFGSPQYYLLVPDHRMMFRVPHTYYRGLPLGYLRLLCYLQGTALATHSSDVLSVLWLVARVWLLILLALLELAGVLD